MSRENDFKIKNERFRLDFRRKFFAVRAVKQLQMLPREVVDATSLKVFKPMLDRALSYLV